MLCDYQPHPLLFVWCFLLAGLLRFYSTHGAQADQMRLLCLIVASFAVDLLSFCVFVMSIAHALPTIIGVLSVWMRSFLGSYMARALVVHRYDRSQGYRVEFLRRFFLCGAALANLVNMAIFSSLVLTLSMLVLKLELQERGSALDAACYSWHIAVFSLGAACAPSNYLSAHTLEGGRAFVKNTSTEQEIGSPQASIAQEVSPMAASAVVFGVLGLLPQPTIGRSMFRRGPTSSARPRRALSATLLFASLAAVGIYLVFVRLLITPESSAGPFLATCGSSVQENIWGLGRRWSLYGLMYGERRVVVPDQGSCDQSRFSQRRGIAMTADGSNTKYTEALYVALYNVRHLHHSQLPVEVFFVGNSEQFDKTVAARLSGLGGIQLLDLLPLLHPSIRSAATSRLRSFAAKPFALLASSFEQVIFMDANVLFFSAPELLFTQQSFRHFGVQLFRDYVRAFRIVDPWLLTEYFAMGTEDLLLYSEITQGAECDSSVVVLDKTRAWKYLHVVAAFNWWKSIFDRHSWGDKDTWALAAVLLGREVDGHLSASAAGSRVGWMSDASVDPPAAVWGHMQFSEQISSDTGNQSRLLYLNWQPHYAAGHIDVAVAGASGSPLKCCMFLEDHWEGPHDEERLSTSRPDYYSDVLQRTFRNVHAAEQSVGIWPRCRTHWWGQVRYRRCFIYFALLGLAICMVWYNAVRAARKPVAQRLPNDIGGEPGNRDMRAR